MQILQQCDKYIYNTFENSVKTVTPVDLLANKIRHNNN